MEDLHHFLKSIDKETYNAYLDAIKKYLASPQAQQFSTENFANTIVNAINEAQ